MCIRDSPRMDRCIGVIAVAATLRESVTIGIIGEVHHIGDHRCCAAVSPSPDVGCARFGVADPGPVGVPCVGRSHDHIGVTIAVQITHHVDRQSGLAVREPFEGHVRVCGGQSAGGKGP